MESDTQRFNLRRIALNDVGLWLTASLRIRKHLFHTFARVLYLEAMWSRNQGDGKIEYHFGGSPRNL